MKLIIIRHGDPDYLNDTLTSKGWEEARLLAERMKSEPPDEIYVSSKGRARDTASLTETELGMTGVVCEWLREFSYANIDLPYKKGAICWNLLPSVVDEHPELYSRNLWREVPFIRESSMPSAFDSVIGELDLLLSKNGYERHKDHYRVTKRNDKTIALFCHFGISGVLLSHLLCMSPFTFWQNCNTRTTSLTVLETEEREDGIANFSMSLMGDVSHLKK
jgi:probable phosphoglycerate mutase